MLQPSNVVPLGVVKAYGTVEFFSVCWGGESSRHSQVMNRLTTVLQKAFLLTSSKRCVTASISRYVFVTCPTLSEHSTSKRSAEKIQRRKRKEKSYYCHKPPPDTR